MFNDRVRITEMLQFWKDNILGWGGRGGVRGDVKKGIKFCY